MLECQRQTYGDGLDPDTLHPKMWAVKGHYYGPTFYNYPYTFGLLFGLGLYASYREDPEGFRAGYDDLLSSTGLADAATLAARFGIDVRGPAFWRSSLEVIREKIAEFERLVG
jgi:oligoendopeptidase F